MGVIGRIVSDAFGNMNEAHGSEKMNQALGNRASREGKTKGRKEGRKD